MELAFPLQIVAVFVSLLFLSNLWKAKSKTKNTQNMQPPEPPGGLPVIGHLHLLGGAKPLFRLLASMADRLGPVFLLRLGVMRVVVVSTCEAAKECFTTNDQALASRPRYASGKHLGGNYSFFGFAPYGPYWREVRKIATLEVLSSRQLELLKHVRAEEVDAFVKELYGAWVDNGKQPVKVDMGQQFVDVMFNVIVMMIAGKRYFGRNFTGDEGEAKRFQKAIAEFFHLGGMILLSDSLPFLKWFDFGGYERAMKKTAKELDSIVTSWLEEHKRMRISGKLEMEGREDFMNVVISTVENANLGGHDQDTVCKMIPLNLIVAGTDTTSAAMTWALSLLLNNSHVLKKAQDELDSHVGKERNVDESDIKNLVYLQAIIKEALRLYPPGPLSVPHMATQSCQINGYHVPAGTWVISNLWKIQRDPRKWLDPEEFRPKRFLTTHAEVDFRGQHFYYLPFGSGRRSCPGIQLATQVMHLTLARLLHGFDVASPLGEPVDMREGSGMTMPRATPLQVLLTPRLPPKLYE